MLTKIKTSKTPPLYLLESANSHDIKELHPPERLKHLRVYRIRQTNILVHASLDTLIDDTEWLHLTVIKPDKTPSMEETIFVRDIFMGDNDAVIFLPKKSDYEKILKMNIENNTPFCMHLWAFLRKGDL